MTAHHGTLLCPKIPTSARGVSVPGRQSIHMPIHENNFKKRQAQWCIQILVHINTSQVWQVSLSLSDYHGGKGYHCMISSLSHSADTNLFFGARASTVAFRSNYDWTMTLGEIAVRWTLTWATTYHVFNPTHPKQDRDLKAVDIHGWISLP